MAMLAKLVTLMVIHLHLENLEFCVADFQVRRAARLIREIILPNRAKAHIIAGLIPQSHTVVKPLTSNGYGTRYTPQPRLATRYSSSDLQSSDQGPSLNTAH